jgi:26S proteasome regulatory subunit N5
LFEKYLNVKINVFEIDPSPYNNEQSDLIHRILEDKALNEIPKYKDLMEKFTNQELIDQRIIESFENELRKAPGTCCNDDVSRYGRVS